MTVLTHRYGLEQYIKEVTGHMLQLALSDNMRLEYIFENSDSGQSFDRHLFRTRFDLGKDKVIYTGIISFTTAVDPSTLPDTKKIAAFWYNSLKQCPHEEAKPCHLMDPSPTPIQLEEYHLGNGRANG